MDHYNSSITLNASAKKLFNALTNEIPLWWTEMFEGTANQEGNLFTVRFGDNVFKTIQVVELEAARKVIWLVKDSLINIPDLNNQIEWIGTTILWEIDEVENGVQLSLTHIGLHPEIECYQICSTGWQEFINSLKLYVETGEGKPYRS